MTDALLKPIRLWTRDEVLQTACVPKSAGVYAWYFREPPSQVPTDGCIVRDGLTLLYIGIAPKAPPRNGASPSARTLHDRLRNHLRGNASGSTLRLTLGCLLGLQLRRVGSSERKTFATDEPRLSEWMGKNALACWIETAEPWLLEEKLIASVCLPLNLDQNRAHPFHATLSALRSEAKRRADSLPVLSCHLPEHSRMRSS